MVWLGVAVVLATVAHWRGISTEQSETEQAEDISHEFRCVMGFLGMVGSIALAQLMRLL